MLIQFQLWIVLVNPTENVKLQSLDGSFTVLTDSKVNATIKNGVTKLRIADFPDNLIMLQSILDFDEDLNGIENFTLSILTSGEESLTGAKDLVSFEISNSNDIINYPIRITSVPEGYVLSNTIYCFSKYDTPEIILKKS